VKYKNEELYEYKMEHSILFVVCLFLDMTIQHCRLACWGGFVRARMKQCGIKNILMRERHIS
jgi:hypothetical protein